MMSIDDALFRFLTADTGVQSLIATRLFKSRITQKTMTPCARYWRVSGDRPYSHDGVTNLPTVRFQIDCCHPKHGEAAAVAAAITAALDSFSAPGVMGGAGGVRVDEISVGEPLDGWDEDLERHIVSIDVEIMHAA